MMHAAHVSRWTVAGLLALGVVSMSIPSPVGPYSAHAQPRPFPRPKPPAPKPPAPSPKTAFATLFVRVDMDCNLYLDDEDEPVTLPAYKPTRVPISVGDHFVRWNVPSANVTFNDRMSIDNPGWRSYDYRVSEDVRIWQAQQAWNARAELLKNGMIVRGDLMWTVRDNGSDVSWNEAKAYCEACRVGGYIDWRMPTIEELQGLYVRGNGQNIAKPFVLTDSWLWSSTLSNSNSSLAFYFAFNHHGRNAHDLADRLNGRVLCVRRSGE